LQEARQFLKCRHPYIRPTAYILEHHERYRQEFLQIIITKLILLRANWALGGREDHTKMSSVRIGERYNNGDDNTVFNPRASFTFDLEFDCSDS
jgi:hypothetical protein